LSRSALSCRGLVGRRRSDPAGSDRRRGTTIRVAAFADVLEPRCCSRQPSATDPRCRPSRSTSPAVFCFSRYRAPSQPYARALGSSRLDADAERIGKPTCRFLQRDIPHGERQAVLRPVRHTRVAKDIEEGGGVIAVPAATRPRSRHASRRPCRGADHGDPARVPVAQRLEQRSHNPLSARDTR
jgi:hypothetical protein